MAGLDYIKEAAQGIKLDRRFWLTVGVEGVVLFFDSDDLKRTRLVPWVEIETCRANPILWHYWNLRDEARRAGAQEPVLPVGTKSGQTVVPVEQEE